MTLWRWRLFSLLAWVAWVVCMFRWGNSREWWALLLAVVLTLTAMLSLQKVGL